MILALHALSGAAIASIMPQPLIALPLAFLGHFALDWLPHTDYSVQAIKEKRRGAWLFFNIGGALLEGSTGFAIILLLLGWHPLLFLAAFLAMLPDGLWVMQSLFPKIPFLKQFRAFHRKLHYRGERKIIKTLPFDVAMATILLLVVLSA